MTIETKAVVTLENVELDALYKLKTIQCDGIPCSCCPLHFKSDDKWICLKYSIDYIYDRYIDFINKNVDDEDYNTNDY